MDTKNPNLLTIYQMLCEQQDALSNEIQKPTTTLQSVNTISNEIQEVAHRIILVQNLLFTNESKQLAELVPTIEASSAQLTKAIGEIQQVTDFLNSVSGFLSDVDEAIDLAKTLAVA
jgi:hypothetical protein